MLRADGQTTVISTFAGCGGSSVGLRKAGCTVVAAIEKDKHAAEAYRLNADPETTVMHRDIRTVSGVELLDIVERTTGRRKLDVLDGSPPCQSWSTGGARGLTADANGRLFGEFVCLVEEVRPRAFVAENVDGLTMGFATIPLSRIYMQLAEAGYSVHGQVLQGEWLGVPQTRHRLFIIGFEEDLGLDARDWFPRPMSSVTTIGDALPHARRIVRLARPEAAQAEWRQEDSWPADRPAPTLTAGGLGIASQDHIRVETLDGEFRPPTLADLLALSTFPPGFVLPGGLRKQWRMLGNSVPPSMMQAVATQIVNGLRSLTT